MNNSNEGESYSYEDNQSINSAKHIQENLIKSFKAENMEYGNLISKKQFKSKNLKYYDIKHRQNKIIHLSNKDGKLEITYKSNNSNNNSFNFDSKNPNHNNYIGIDKIKH